MIQSTELTPLFRQLGLTTYESGIWQALLEKGEADAHELIRITGVPFGRVYDVLNSLVEKGIIDVQETRPKLYRPRRIGGVIDHLLQSKRTGMDSEYKQLEEAAEVAKRRFVTLGRKLPKDEVFVSVALGEHDIQKLLRESMYSAEDEILIAMGHVEYASNLSHLVEDAVQRLADAAARGVSVRVMLSSQIPSSLKGFKPELAKLTRRLQSRVYPGTLNHFKVVDRQYVVLEIIDPYEPESRIALVQMLSKKLGEHMAQIFERCWRNSQPLYKVAETYLASRVKNGIRSVPNQSDPLHATS